MEVPIQLLPGIAALLRYPVEADDDLAPSLADAAMALGHPCQEFLEAFALTCRTSSLQELQEIYTRAFDLNPECTLEIGWHLFGDTYKRGQFLVMMRHHLQEHDIRPEPHLPDFLPALLELSMRLEHQDALDLVDDCVLPALEKILPALKGNPYAHLLQALFLIFTVHRIPSGGDRPGSEAPCVPPGAPHGEARRSPASPSMPSEVNHAR